MFGVTVEGIPDARRLNLPDDWPDGQYPAAEGLEARPARGSHPRRKVMSFQIPIGPQHPALKEPISLRMTVEGEVITDVDIRLGYNHRGLEKLAEEKTWIQNIYLTERICGICSHSHATCYVQGVEKLMELAPPRRGLYIRYLVSELERVHSHLLWLGVAGHEAGFDSFFMYTWRDREIVMDLLEMISGNRVHYAINTIGGVRRDLDEGQKAKILEGVATLRKRSEYYFRIGANEPSFVARIAGVGMLSKEQAIALCAVGPVARASGVARDVRKEDPYAVYDELDFELCTADTLRRPRPGRRPGQGAPRVLQDDRADGQGPAGRRHRRQGPAQGQARRGRQPLRGARAARTSTTSRPTGRTSPSASRSGPPRWPTTRPRWRCSGRASSPTSP